MKPLPILSQLNYPVLIAMAVLLGLAPFRPEPHLLEKLHLLLAGQPLRGIDIIDLLFHAFPLALLLLKSLTEGPRLKDSKR